jgi:SAM-dependent methyltransferase
MLKFFGNGDIKFLLKAYLRTLDLQGKVVVDIPAGTGYTTKILHERGARPEAYDLFPEFFEVEGLSCRKADLSQKLPIANAHADFVICQEGIEHLPNQFFPLQEFNRILRPGGRLILTTPSLSHLRAKLSHLLIESEIYNRLPANELDSVWFSEGPEIYFGHVFLTGIQRLRVLAKLAGFKIVKIHKVKASPSALMLGILFYPFILLFNLYAYFVSLRRLPNVEKKLKKQTYREILKLNLHPAIQFGKHLFIEFEKQIDCDKIKHALHKNREEIC